MLCGNLDKFCNAALFLSSYKLNISFDPFLYLFLDFVHASEEQFCVDAPNCEDLIDAAGKHKNK